MAKEFPLEKIPWSIPVLMNDPNSLETFLGKSDLVYSTLSLEPSKKFFIQCVKSCVTGSLKILIQNLNTWELIRSQLIKSIMPVKTVFQLQVELYQTTLGINESVQEFSDKILIISNALNNAHLNDIESPSKEIKAAILTMCERAALDQFINGLSGNLKLLVKARNFQSFQQAIAYSKLNENELNRLDFQKDDEFSQHNNFIQETDNFISCSYCGLTNHIFQNCLRRMAENQDADTRHLSYMSARDQFISQRNQPNFMDNLSVNNKMNYYPLNSQQNNFQ